MNAVETIHSATTDSLQERLTHYANELMNLVLVRHAKAQFRGPWHRPDEQLWVVEAYFDDGEDFELQEQLSERETDILLKENLWLCVVPLPVAAYTPP
jgi:hypothetical protein